MTLVEQFISTCAYLEKIGITQLIVSRQFYDDFCAYVDATLPDDYSLGANYYETQIGKVRIITSDHPNYVGGFFTNEGT